MNYKLLLFCCLFGASTLAGQTGSSKLLIAEAGQSFGSSTGLATEGDSAQYFYNSNQQLTKQKRWFYSTAGTWLQSSQSKDYSYDAQGNLLYVLNQLGNDVVGWSDNYRFFYTYDSLSNQLTNKTESWAGSVWKPVDSTQFVYNTNGKLISETHPNYRILFSYNAQNQIAFELRQLLENGTWKNSQRTDFAYPPGELNPSFRTTFYWNNNLWIKYNRQAYTYSASGKVLIHLDQTLNGNDWVDRFNLVYTYDANDLNISWLVEERENGAWVPYFQQINEFDADGYPLSERLDYWIGAWTLEHFRRFHYQESVATQAPSSVQFAVFPNPATNQVTLQGENLRQVKILDLQGRVVRQQSLQGQETESLVLGLLPAGNYLIQVATQEGKIGLKPLQIK